jgi:hypothetical protein
MRTARVDEAQRAAINRRIERVGGNSLPEVTRECFCETTGIASNLGRFSSAVEQRFCKPKVGSSILSTGTSIQAGIVSPDV